MVHGIRRSRRQRPFGTIGAVGLPGSLPVSYHLIHIGEAARKNHTGITFQRGTGPVHTALAAPHWGLPRA